MQKKRKINSVCWGTDPDNGFYADVEYDDGEERVWVDILPDDTVQIMRENSKGEHLNTLFLHRGVLARIAASMIEGEIG